MKRAFQLAWRYVVHHRFKSLLMVMCIVLTLLMPIALSILLSSFNRQIVARAESTPLIVGAKGSRVEGLEIDDADECLGINTRRELADAARVMRRRIVERHLEAGVTFVDPETVYIDADVRIGRDSIIAVRGDDDRVRAFYNVCQHRGNRLVTAEVGTLATGDFQCAYHGWRFDTGGTCRAIPSVVEEQNFQVDRITVRAYPAREVQGNVWIWFGKEKARAEEIGDPPVMPDVGDASGKLIESQRFPCAVDHAVIGLMDPAHGPFVHRSWWWRS